MTSSEPPAIAYPLTSRYNLSIRPPYPPFAKPKPPIICMASDAQFYKVYVANALTKEIFGDNNKATFRGS